MLYGYSLLQMRHSSESHNVARLRVFLGEKQPAFAELIGCSVHSLQSIETGRLKLSEPLARRISTETGVHLRWLLENNLKVPIVKAGFGRTWTYTRSDYECAQASKTIGVDKLTEQISEDYAASFYAQIRAILSSAAKAGRARVELATWKLAKFLEDCRREFGHDTKLVESKEQFGLRADDSPYLKHRQVNAGISLFRKYNQERTRSIRRTLAQLKKAHNKKAQSKKA